ncbi:MAG: hypothetical protein IIB38_06415 [Candidatus Hydrogenedentes bacterium]|nr:hypothetical protein [Candidatus Hydrogenedentota bacterium]
MVTLFRIVIFFPEIETEYFKMAIVQIRDTPWRNDSVREELQVPSPDDALERLDAEVDLLESYPWSTLPQVDLPTLEFGELDRLRIRREGLKVRSRYTQLFGSERPDAWSRFGRRISAFSDALSRFTQTTFSDRERLPQPVSRPAPGFVAYVEWFSGPTDRAVLSTVKIQTLWGVRPAELIEPIALVFKVNREGRVTQVLQTTESFQGIADSAAKALMNYRFETVGPDAPRYQHGTFLIRAESGPL